MRSHGIATYDGSSVVDTHPYCAACNTYHRGPCAASQSAYAKPLDQRLVALWRVEWELRLWERAADKELTPRRPLRDILREQDAELDALGPPPENYGQD